MMEKLTAKQALLRIADECVEDIMEMSDEDIMTEAVEQYGSPEAALGEIDRIKGIIQDVIEKHHMSRT